MITHKRANKGSGIYAVYWEHTEEKEGGFTTMVTQPHGDEAPQNVKVMVAQALLDDLEIPIRIDDYKLKVERSR
jgi:hypothetical protein